MYFDGAEREIANGRRARGSADTGSRVGSWIAVIQERAVQHCR